MKFAIGKFIAILAIACASALSLAQEVTVADVVGSPGATTPAISVDYVAGGSVVGFQFDILFDQASLGAPTLSCNSDLSNDSNNCGLICTNPQPGIIRIICADADLSVQTSGNIGSFTFDVPGGTPVGVYVLEIDAENNGGGFSDAGAGSVTPSALNDGSVTLEITGAAGYDSTPAPGETINLGAGVIDGTPSDNSPSLITVSEIGDQDLNVTAITFTGPNAAEFSTTTAPFTIVDGGPDVDVDISCQPTVRGALTATVELTNNSINAPNPQYSLECAGESPNVQVPAGPINITGLTVDPSAPTANINVTNPQDGFTSDANNVTATAGAGDPEITVTTGGPTTITPDGNFDFVVECDNTNAGSFSRTIDITWDEPGVPRGGSTGSASVTVNCEITDEVASYDSIPAPGATIDLGTTTNGVASAAQTIDVSNDGVGTTTASDLTITGATTSDPQFSVTFDGTAIPVGDTLVDAVEVTCTPDPGTNGLITATLSVTHDGDANPASPVQYDLECTGEPDGAFSSTPAPDGSLNLGVVPPNSPTPVGTIDFFNNGDADDIDVACTFTGPAEIEFLSDPFDETIAPGGSVSAEFQCTPSTPEIFQGTLTCDVTGDQNFVDPINYTVECRGQPLVVPTMNHWGLIIMSLMLLMVAGLFGRRWFAAQS